MNLLSVKPKVAVIGSGYWGKNHVRNFYQLGALKTVCDSDPEALQAIKKNFPEIDSTTEFKNILDDQEIKGIVIATPAVSHFEIAMQAMQAGKDVLVEKPLALNEADGESLVNESEKLGSILMVGHILLYHPGVSKLKEIVQRGDLGRIQHIQSNRLSLGKIRSEENILWSFAPHDISMIMYLLDEMPDRVYATGFSHLQRNVEDVTISVLEFPSGVSSHIYVSWMNPFKEQRLTVMGSKGMAIFEDSRPDNKLRILHNEFTWVNRHPVPSRGDEEQIHFEPGEPLRLECEHFLHCIKTRQRPITDGAEGLRALRVLQQCYESMKTEAGCRAILPQIQPPIKEKEFFAHESALIDEPCNIGKGTKIWHFSHIMKDAEIGQNCNIGANVLIGKSVKIGNGCKIQNNVSVYEGVTLEDHVFCGPSMVFTNVYNPRCEIPRMAELRTTLVKKGATLGANSTIVCGHEIGSYSFIGAGSVVTKDVPDYALMMGNPARRSGWMCRCGVRLPDNAPFSCPVCGDNYALNGSGKLEPVAAKKSPIKVPLLDLKAQYLTIKSEIDEAINKVLETQRFIGGPEVEALENEIAEYCGCKYAIGVSSGTDALLVSLMALGIGPGDEVITTPFTFFATVGSIMRLGATPVFADIDPVTFNIDPEFVKSVITEETKAIIPVHLFGQCAEMDPIMNMARENGLHVIEDAAQAIGAEYKGRRAGSMGTIGCFSFFPSKNLGGFGDGGMITTNDSELAEKTRIIRNQGAKPKYYHKILGGNFRLDGLHAAILRVKLRHLENWSRKRQDNAAYYTMRFEEEGVAGRNIVTPTILQDRHVFNQYVIRVQNRDALKKLLKDNSIDTEIYYPGGLHLQECMSHLNFNQGDFPMTEQATKEVLALPVFPELTEDQRAHVAQSLSDFCR